MAPILVNAADGVSVLLPNGNLPSAVNAAMLGPLVCDVIDQRLAN